MYTRRFAVYNQETDPLGNEIIREVTKDKRTTQRNLIFTGGKGTALYYIPSEAKALS